MLGETRTSRRHDLGLLATAVNYDLQDKEERRRSARELANFYFRAVQALEPDLFIEAGAKDAGSSRRARKLLESARVVAFEANPYTYERFAPRNPPETGVEYRHLALSDRPGRVAVQVHLDDGGRPQADGRGSLLERGEEFGHDVQPVEVEASSLDTFFADTTFERCALWIDVEGATELVLKGGARVLERAVLVMVEVEERRYWEHGWQMPDVVEHLDAFGLVPIARDFEYPYQYNLVFAREEDLLRHATLRLRLTQYLSRAASRRVEQASAGAGGGRGGGPAGARWWSRFRGR